MSIVEILYKLTIHPIKAYGKMLRRLISHPNYGLELSDRISKDLKKRGMNFVGTTIIYAYLQAVGVIDDHVINCFYKSIKT